MSMKNPLTLAGIEPATFQFVARHLNHCATAVPTLNVQTYECCGRTLLFVSYGIQDSRFAIC